MDGLNSKIKDIRLVMIREIEESNLSEKIKHERIMAIKLITRAQDAIISQVIAPMIKDYYDRKASDWRNWLLLVVPSLISIIFLIVVLALGNVWLVRIDKVTIKRFIYPLRIFDYSLDRCQHILIYLCNKSNHTDKRLL